MATNTGTEFEDEDVAAAYVHRPDYPAALHGRLLQLAGDRARLLDLGCGPGKLARALAPGFGAVIAADPSAAMLRAGRDLDAGRNGNIDWVQVRGEDLELEPGSVGLAVAGASIHWMEPAVTFPMLARALAPGAVLALVDGDGPSAAPWLEAFGAVSGAWIERLGDVVGGPDYRHRMGRHEPWLEVQGREVFMAEVRQPLEDFIHCQHSRATWARSKMGDLADAFDAELRAALAPWAEDGVLTYEMAVRLVWGRPRAAI